MEFEIWLKHDRKIWNFTRRSRVKFQIFLWCLKAKFQIPLSAEGCLLLTPRHLWNLTKICGVWAKFSQILKICENLTQTPQILVKFHRFWVVISGGEWCYQTNKQITKSYVFNLWCNACMWFNKTPTCSFPIAASSLHQWKFEEFFSLTPATTRLFGINWVTGVRLILK